MNKLTLIVLTFLISITAQASIDCESALARLMRTKPIAKTVGDSNSNKFSDSLPKIENLLKERTEAGELSKDELTVFILNARNLDKQSNGELFGEGAIECMDTFSIKAVKGFMSLVNSSNANYTGDAYEALVKSSQKHYGDSKRIAKKRICFLSGKGEKCQIFGKAIAKKCN